MVQYEYQKTTSEFIYKLRVIAIVVCILVGAAAQAGSALFLVFGEVTSKGYCDVQSKVRETLRNIGYTSASR